MTNTHAIASRKHDLFIHAIRRIALILFCLAFGLSVFAAGHVPVQTFYIPLPEDDLLQSLKTIAGGRTGDYAPADPVHSYISIAIFADNTRIYFDQWEGGYDFDIANSQNLYNSANNPGGSQIWGDGDLSNGVAPGYPADILNAGDVILLESEVVSANREATIDFDGGDKFASTKPVAVTRAVWASGSATMFGGANEVYDTAFWGTAFQCPVGTNIPDADDAQMFEYTGLSIMAGAGGATVQVDADNDGIFETRFLAEGKAWLVDGGMHVGGRVLADKPVQVDLITGDIYSYYESRFMRLLPTAYWSSSQATPVATPSTAGTTVWLYNPGAAAIDLLYVRRSSNGNSLITNTLNVAAGGYRKQQLEVSTSGARFINANKKPFYALATVDSFGTRYTNALTGTDDNSAHDWGFALVPESSLTPQVLVGLGIGRDPTSTTNPNENGSPVWVTPIGNGESPVTVYVDYDSDPTTGAFTDPNNNKYDASYTAKELQQLKIYNPSGTQSGMLVYVLEPDVKLAAAWGSDPAKASVSQPGLDFGTGIPPFPLYVANKYSELLIDADNDGHISPGDTLRYSIVIENTGRQPVTGLDLQDILPPGITYIPENTFFVNADSTTNSILDNALPSYETIFPLDEGGIPLPENVLPVRRSWEVHYTVVVDGYDSLPAGVVSLQNTATVGGSGLTTTNSIVNYIHGRLGDYVWWDKNKNGIQDAGEPGVNGAIVSLLDENGAPVLDEDGHPMTTVTSNDAQSVAGYYCFVGVKADDYRVAFQPPEQFLLTIVNSDGVGVGGVKNSDADPTTGWTEVFSLAGGQIRTDIDAGLVEKPSCVAGAVLLDVNGDGVVDPEDTQGLAGVTVKLLDVNLQVVATTITGATGHYRFDSVYSGVYTLVQVLPSGYTNTYDVVGANDLRIPVTLLAGGCTLNQDFYDTRIAGGAIGNKVLYLSGPGRAMDRIDPVAAGDTTTLTATLAAPVLGAQAITVVGTAISSTSTQTANTHSFSYNSGSTGENRILMVGVSYRNNDNETVTSVSYGGQGMTSVGTQRNSTNGRVYIYRLLNPPMGSHSLLVNWNSRLNQGAVVGAVTYAGVNQTTPTGTFASNSGSSATPSVPVGSAAGRLVFGVVGGRTTSNYTVTGGGTQLWSSRPYSGSTAGSGQSKAGAASVALSWSGSSTSWVAGGVSLNPAPSVTDPSFVTFTQAPQFALPFTMRAGTTLSITNYITVASGSMPANPDVTAYLSVDGSAFMVLTDPVYNGSTLVWSGTLESDVNIAPGQAIALAVLNEQLGVAFSIRYDSSTYPSKIVLPTPSIIAIPSLGVYTAAYAGGTLVDNSAALETRYIRFTVTDPFGAYDITGASLAINGPGTQGDLNVTLNDAYVVASNSYSKTYEYPWQTVDLGGTFNITVTADEGTEGIQATSEVEHTLFIPAALYGYLFIDKNNDQIRNTGDITITNVLVSLIVDGRVIATTNTNNEGHYYFVDVPAGAVTVRAVYPVANLVAVPQSEDERRNRAIPSGADTAVIVHAVRSGDGVLPGQPGEPLNFGYEMHPLSTALGLRVYADADGKVMIEISTVNENGNHDIEVYAQINGEWVLVATIPADQIIGFGSNTYIVEAFGLNPGESYEFKIVDESGHIFESGSIQVARSLVAVETMTLTPDLITISFKTTPGLRYQVMVCESLGAPWRVEYVQSPTKKGWSALNNAPFNAGPGTSTAVLVPRNNRAKAFFKIMQVE